MGILVRSQLIVVQARWWFWRFTVWACELRRLLLSSASSQHAYFAGGANFQHGGFVEDLHQSVIDVAGGKPAVATRSDEGMGSIGARVGLPVVDADTLDTCLVTSYNGS
jgi:hypothetical protein